MNKLLSKHNSEIDYPVYKDTNNPRALVHILPERLAEAVNSVPDEWLGLEETEFLRSVQPKVTSVDRQLRIKFWEEYDNCTKRKSTESIAMTRVCRGVCSFEYFFKHFLSNPKKVAYMLIPVTEYEIALKEKLVFSVTRLSEILEAPLVDSKTGKLDARAAEVFLKTLQFIDTRLHGAVIQRVEQKNLNVNVDSTQAIVTPDSMEDLQKQLTELQDKLKSAPIDVEAIALNGDEERQTELTDFIVDESPT